jgi:hypothetical protein
MKFGMNKTPLEMLEAKFSFTYSIQFHVTAKLCQFHGCEHINKIKPQVLKFCMMVYVLISMQLFSATFLHKILSNKMSAG